MHLLLYSFYAPHFFHNLHCCSSRLVAETQKDSCKVEDKKEKPWSELVLSFSGTAEVYKTLGNIQDGYGLEHGGESDTTGSEMYSSVLVQEDELDEYLSKGHVGEE